MELFPFCSMELLLFCSMELFPFCSKELLLFRSMESFHQLCVLLFLPFCTIGWSVMHGWESSKFQKSWTFKIQILKLAVCLQSFKNFKFKWSIAQIWTENKSEKLLKSALFSILRLTFYGYVIFICFLHAERSLNLPISGWKAKLF